jgi:hypothetical protein
MLYDHRTYTCRPGTLAKHLAIYEQYGKGPQSKHLGDPVAYLVAESGDLNTYVHVWAYKDAADRSAKRAAMAADPEWQTYLAKSGEAGYLLKQQNNLMTPVAFYPAPKA